MRKRYTFTERPANIPESWEIYNAPRPLAGAKDWTGDFLSGIFYAAIDPASGDADYQRERNNDLDAALLVFVDEAQAMDEIIAYYRQRSGKDFSDKKEEYRSELLTDWLRLKRSGELR